MKDYIKKIFRLILWVLLIGLIANCSTVKKIPIENKYQIIKKDSIIFSIRDSVKIIPIEKIMNVTLPTQTSNLETSLASSKAYTDSLGFLHHTLENKKIFKQHTHTEEKETVKVDSVFVKVPEPYKVEVRVKYVPWFYKFTLWWFIISIFGIIFIFLLKHFKKKLYLL